MGDGFCHDVLNIEECNYDKGDCCGSVVHTNACKECKCLNPDLRPYASDLTVAECPEEISLLVNNGYCDDETNNPK